MVYYPLTCLEMSTIPLLRGLLLLPSFFLRARSEMRLLLVKLNPTEEGNASIKMFIRDARFIGNYLKPTKGRWSPEKAGSWRGGCVSHGRRSLSSTSKLDVSVGELT